MRAVYRQVYGQGYTRTGTPPARTREKADPGTVKSRIPVKSQIPDKKYGIRTRIMESGREVWNPDEKSGFRTRNVDSGLSQACPDRAKTCPDRAKACPDRHDGQAQERPSDRLSHGLTRSNTLCFHA